MTKTSAATLAILLLVARPSPAQVVIAAVTAQDLKRLSIEELTQIDVTSVSRRAEKLSETAAAVSVINEEDIRRSGVTTLAETMRLADSLDVARANSSSWGISARGFNTNPSNKMLVLIDGRTVYSPLSAGTFWDAQEALLPDIDRVEVIRGPGGAIWGANAVNGVINVITKDAASTRGDYVSVAAGNDEQAYVAARHGGRFRADGSYRVYGKYRKRGAQLFTNTGLDAGDGVQIGQGGFRIDSGSHGAVQWLVEGDLYRGSNGFSDRPDGDIGGGNVLTRWTRTFSTRSEFQAQVYYDGTYRKVPLQFTETRHTIDLDTQQRWKLGSRHELLVGGGFRVTRGDDLGIAGFFFDPQVRRSTLASVFAQDEIAFAPQHLYLTLGSKFERNDFTGVEAQPTVRARWSPASRHTVWGAVSRAVRLPTRFDTDLRLIDVQTRRVTITGTQDFESENVISYEGGYRVRPVGRLALDFSAFSNRYDDLRSTELTFTPAPLIVLMNLLNARTSGLETSGTLQALANWRLHGSYTYFHKALTFDPGSRDVFRGTVEGDDPSHLVSMRSYVDLPHGLAFDAFFRRTSRRPDPVVSRYAELDLRLGWTARPGWDLSLIGQSLLHPHHSELLPPNAPHYDFRRGVFVRSAWHF